VVDRHPRLGRRLRVSDHLRRVSPAQVITQ
jgi:hypothetical protein